MTRHGAVAPQTGLCDPDVPGHASHRDFDPAEVLEGVSRQTGTRLGVPMAVGFEALNLGWA